MSGSLMNGSRVKGKGVPFVGTREKRKGENTRKPYILILPTDNWSTANGHVTPSIPNDFRRRSQSTVFTPFEPFLANRIPFCILRSLCGNQRGESCAYFRSGRMSDGKFGRLPSNLEHYFRACRTRENRRDRYLKERLYNSSLEDHFAVTGNTRSVLLTFCT